MFSDRLDRDVVAQNQSQRLVVEPVRGADRLPVLVVRKERNPIGRCMNLQRLVARREPLAILRIGGCNIRRCCCCGWRRRV